MAPQASHGPVRSPIAGAPKKNRPFRVLFATPMIVVLFACGPQPSPTATANSATAPDAIPGGSASAGIAAASSGVQETITDVCHRTNTTHDFVLISIPGPAAGEHIAHGDGLVGEAVPGMPGQAFGPACELVVIPSPSFFVDDTPPPARANDIEWQTAVGSFAEIDFLDFANGSPAPEFRVGNVTVTVSVPIPGWGGTIFAGGYVGGGGQYGTVFDNALVAYTAITFSFSTPVLGFGTWIFDDGSCCADSYAMTANGMTSDTLDSNPGLSGHIVEGFIGVKDTAGISQVTVFNTNQGGVFELDHIQIAERLQ